MGDGMHFSLRLSRDNPEHRKVIQFLDEMDVKKYKSKTNFIAQAVSFYIECIEDGSLEKLKDKNFRKFSMDYVSREELNEKLKNISDTIEKKVYKEIISVVMGSTTRVVQEAVPVRQEPDATEESNDNTLVQDLSKYSGVMDSVLSWSED